MFVGGVQHRRKCMRLYGKRCLSMRQLWYANVKVTFREMYSTLAILQYYVATKMPRNGPFTGFEYTLLGYSSALLGKYIVTV